jgi:hypothetical protein
MFKTTEEMHRVMGRQLIEFERIERGRNILRGNASKHEVITDPLKIHELMSEERNQP